MGPRSLADWAFISVVIGAVGAVFDAPGLIVVAIATVGNAALAQVWSHYGMRGVEYRRTLATTRAVAGDEVGLDVSIWNRKPLPLPWISADDVVTAGLIVRERPSMDRDDAEPTRRVLRNAWALAWFERVVRHFHLDDLRRGVYEFGPVHVRIRDILGREAVTATEEESATLIVGPRTAVLRRNRSEIAPIGERRARQSLHTDPSLYGGVRPFQPGDSLRRVHWRATARLGSPVSRRYEPARGREVVIAIDVQQVEGTVFELEWDEAWFEALCIVAASLTRQLLADGASVGLAAATFAAESRRQAWLPPQATQGQLARAEALLARIGPIPSGPFGGLLTWLTRRLPPGATVMVLSGRDPHGPLPAIRRLRRSGYSVEFIAVGPESSQHASTARRAGLPAVAAEVLPDVERAEAVLLAG